MKKMIVFTIFISLVVCGNVFALEPMRIKVRAELPTHIETVGQAAQYYADSIGYKLITKYPAPPESIKIAYETIDPNARKNTIIPIEDAILELLAPDYFLVLDNKHKLFSFEEGAE